MQCAASAAVAQDAAATAAAAAPAPSNDPLIRKLDGILVDIKGRGLYTFDNDKTPGKSDCNNQCRLLWPPLKAAAGAVPKGPFTLAVLLIALAPGAMAQQAPAPTEATDDLDLDIADADAAPPAEANADAAERDPTAANPAPADPSLLPSSSA